MVTNHTLRSHGVTLHYEVRGTGPLLLLVGAPMEAAPFAPVADALAGDHTVVTHDPRGISASVLDDPDQDSTPDLRADDVAAVLDALDADSADVVGSSGGAVTGLAMVARHPGRVRTLVAHEPPVLELLPDADERRAEVDDIVATFHRDGMGPAFGTFIASVGFDRSDPGSPARAPEQSSEQQRLDGARFLAHELRGTTRYVPDIAALTSGRTQVVIGIGAESSHLLTYRTSTALTERLGIAPVEFPGAHTGFIDHPEEFAATIRRVLAD